MVTSVTEGRRVTRKATRRGAAPRTEAKGPSTERERRSKGKRNERGKKVKRATSIARK